MSKQSSTSVPPNPDLIIKSQTTPPNDIGQIGHKETAVRALMAGRSRRDSADDYYTAHIKDLAEKKQKAGPYSEDDSNGEDEDGGYMSTVDHAMNPPNRIRRFDSADFFLGQSDQPPLINKDPRFTITPSEATSSLSSSSSLEEDDDDPLTMEDEVEAIRPFSNK